MSYKNEASNASAHYFLLEFCWRKMYSNYMPSIKQKTEGIV